MIKRFFTPEELQRWAKEDPPRVLEAGLAMIVSLMKRSQQLKEAREEIKVKDARISELEALLEAAQRASFRQAAPFRVKEEKRVAEPKRPGRKAGHCGAFRPRPERIDEEITVELSACAKCGSLQWEDRQPIEQFIEEIPVVRPRVTRLCTYEATCAGCGEPGSSRHPLQVSQATGAAAVQLGPRALAIAADLNKAKCLSMRKTCAVLQDHFGLRLTPGGLSQALTRVALKVEPPYFDIHQQLFHAPSLHVDETSWWVAGCLWWLWVFTHPQGTFYFIDKGRGREVLYAVLGDAFAGVLVSDCLGTYDLETGAQQKCYSHHLKAIGNAAEIHPEAAQGFLTQIATLLKRALALGKEKALRQAQGLAFGSEAQVLDPAVAGPAHFLEQRRQVEREVEALLAAPCEHAGQEAVRNRLFKQRDHLFTFLDHDGVDATNNLAERQLRPAVIARKISCGNKTATGAKTFQILASIAATCTQLNSSFIDRIAAAMPLDST
jgi:transposase